MGTWSPPEEPLTDLEEKWKEKTEKKYHCTIDYTGLDMSYGEDSTIYIRITFGRDWVLYRKVDSNIEKVTTEIAESFLNETEKGRKQSHILIRFAPIDNTPNYDTGTGYNRDEEFRCYYSIANKKVVKANTKVVDSAFQDLSSRLRVR